MAQLKIAIAGANGRMGRTLVQAVEANPNTILVGALDRAGSGVLGLDAGFALGIKTGVKVTDNADIALDDADVLIDFTRPSASLPLIEKCAAKGIKMVIGTTGFDDAGKAAIAAAAQKNAIVFAANFSVGVNLTFHILDTVSRVLNEGYDIEIIEAHHHHKVDAPSGTALRMGEVIANAVGRDLWARRAHRRARPENHRLFHHSRGRYCGRAYGAVCHRWRARGNHPQSQQPHDVCLGRSARRRVAAKPSDRLV